MATRRANFSTDVSSAVSPSDFIRKAIRRTWPPAASTGSRRAGRRSRTATSASATPRRSPSTSTSPASSAGSAACASTTPTRSARSWSTCSRSRRTSAGSASTGASTSTTPPTTTSGCTSWPNNWWNRGTPTSTACRAEQISEYRGAPTRPGRESPDRNRPPAESLDLLRRMRAGEFADGAYVLRARIDMASPNLNLRDPVMYRIRRAATTAPATPGASIRCTTGARPERLDRRGHPLAVLTGVREQPPAVRLVPGQAGDLPLAADRVQPPQRGLRRAAQAHPAPAGGRTARCAAGTTRAC